MISAVRKKVDPEIDPSAFPAEIAAASGATIARCYQCRKCTSGCPVADRGDIKPHELVQLVLLGQQEEVLASTMIWECTSCQTCVSRCPQNVDLPAIIDALRQKSRLAKKGRVPNTVPKFNDIFLRTVRRLGRVYELGLMASFKLRTLNLFQDLGKFPMMLRKRKMALLPPFVPGRVKRKRIFKRSQQQGEQKR